MKRKVNVLSRFKLVYRPAKTSLKIALLAGLVLATVALFVIHGAIRANENRTAANRERSESLIGERHDLNQKIDSIGSKDGLVEYAEQELGMVDKDSVIYVPGN